LEKSLNSFHPQKILQNLQQRLDEANLKMEHHFKEQLTKFKNRLNVLSNQLKELSPYDALKRGYSILQQQKKIINSIKKINQKELLEIILSDGKCDCEVKEISSEKHE